ncbi:MAG: DUF4404 family protein [Elusimicrobia bacterium]|nr:DUF4404 family protein [Elusimicrobiota bacterium]
MIQDNLKKLEGAIRGLGAVDPKKKTELLGLVEALKAEAGRLSTTHQAIGRLTQSVRAFEGAHPKLVESVDEISRLLSSLGI